MKNQLLLIKIGMRFFKKFTSFLTNSLCFIFAIIGFSMLVSSCTTQKQLSFFHDIDAGVKENFYPFELPDYKLQKQDILYVKFTTINEEINTSLNGGSITSNQNMFESERGIYINGFAVDDSGYINLPVIGLVNVLGLTIGEATSEIEDKSSVFLKEATVIVKLVSFKVTLLGEINNPGIYNIYNAKVTILEAIGLAAGITDYGDRSRILIVRATKEGSNTFWVNLQKKEMLSSEGYFLLPNDLVIVYPLKAKLINMNTPTISFFLSTIVTTISLTLLILSL